MHRTKQSVKNAIFSLSCQMLQLLMQMATRIFFIRIIGQEYLGINSLFTDILTALQLVELGIGPAIAYSLYKPLANNEIEKIKSLMNLFKKAYRIIGLFILIAGIIFTPFYGFFINEIPEVSNLDIIYFIFVLNTAISYFYSYYRTLLISDQKKYLDISIQTGITSIISIIQIGIIYITNNYILYLVAHVVGTILINYIASRIAIRQYPYLKSKKIEKLDKETYDEIKKNVFAMIFHKVGSIIRDATDNLLISKYIGIITTGIYSNYSMITKALTNIISQIFAAVLSSVGNLHATTDEEAQKDIFYKINYINFIIASICSCCFGILIQPFILIISNETYLLDIFIVILITLRLYLDTMRKTPWMFCEAAGIYWNGKTKPIWEIIVNLIVSLALVKMIGISGIFIGTIASIILIDLTVEPYLAFKYVLNGGLKKYYIKYVIYFIIFILMYMVSYYICSLIPDIGIVTFIIKGIITVGITILSITISTFKTKEFRYVIEMIKKYIISIIKK